MSGWGVYRVDSIANGLAVGVWIKERKAVWMGSEDDAKAKSALYNVQNEGTRHVALPFAQTKTMRLPTPPRAPQEGTK